MSNTIIMLLGEAFPRLFQMSLVTFLLVTMFLYYVRCKNTHDFTLIQYYRNNSLTPSNNIPLKVFPLEHNHICTNTYNFVASGIYEPRKDSHKKVYLTLTNSSTYKRPLHNIFLIWRWHGTKRNVTKPAVTVYVNRAQRNTRNTIKRRYAIEY